MYSHGNRVADPQLLDNAIHALRDYTEARRGSRPFPDGPDRQLDSAGSGDGLADRAPRTNPRRLRTDPD
jgi:hypothetical protein